jgi:predicted PurR-regulated permease PerM
MYVVGTVWSVLVVFGGVILLFLLAWIVSFILEPVAAFLCQRGMSRIIAVSLVYTALLIVVSGAIVLAVPSFGGQIQQLAREITTIFSADNLPTLNQKAVGLLRHFGLRQKDAQNIVNQISAHIPGWASSLSSGAITFATNLVTSLFNIIFDTSLVLIISFYIMLDGARLMESVVVKLPPVWVDDVRLFQRNIKEIFGGFFRAQLIVAGIYAAFTWIILLALGQANGLLVALLAGVIMLLPFIGAFLAIAPPLLLVLIQTPPNQILVKVILLVFLLAVAQHIVLNLLAPKIFGHHIGVPTLVLFAALLLGAKEGGVWGAFFAAPVVGVGYAMFEVFYERWSSKSSLFQPANDDESDETIADESSAGDDTPPGAPPLTYKPRPKASDNGGDTATGDSTREPLSRGAGTPR